jgi:hypothetical protein
MPSNSKFSRPTIPNDAQNNDCDDSNRLQKRIKREQKEKDEIDCP